MVDTSSRAPEMTAGKKCSRLTRSRVSLDSEQASSSSALLGEIAESVKVLALEYQKMQKELRELKTELRRRDFHEGDAQSSRPRGVRDSTSDYILRAAPGRVIEEVAQPTDDQTEGVVQSSQEQLQPGLRVQDLVEGKLEEDPGNSSHMIMHQPPC